MPGKITTDAIFIIRQVQEKHQAKKMLYYAFVDLEKAFEVVLYQGSVLSRLLFAAVMDVVSSEARSGLPSELLYADDLVLMAPTMDQPGRRVTEWRTSLLDKGLKVNTGNYKVMVGSSGEKMIVNSGKWPCGKEVQVKSGFTSGVRGALARVADGFMCKRCDGTIQEADLAEDLMVDIEMYGCVKSFC